MIKDYKGGKENQEIDERGIDDKIYAVMHNT